MHMEQFGEPEPVEARISLEDSVYNWAKFENRCDLVKNYLLSQNSLCKSEGFMQSEVWTPKKV